MLLRRVLGWGYRGFYEGNGDQKGWWEERGKRIVPIARLKSSGRILIPQLNHPPVRRRYLLSRSAPPQTSVTDHIGNKTKAKKPTAFKRSFIVLKTPGGTCFPGIPVTLIAGFFSSLDLISTIISSKKSRSCTEVKDSFSPLPVRCCFAWGVVMMGISRRREASTCSSKWSLECVGRLVVE